MRLSKYRRQQRLSTGSSCISYLAGAAKPPEPGSGCTEDSLSVAASVSNAAPAQTPALFVRPIPPQRVAVQGSALAIDHSTARKVAPFQLYLPGSNQFH